MRRLILLLPLVLAACGFFSEGPLRFAVPMPQEEGAIAVAVESIEVREAELPLYAQLEEIYVRGPDGGLRSDGDVLWADEPRRAVTQSLVLALSDITDARVASEPWPFEDFPEARLEVRFDQLMAQEGGVFGMSGQYYLVSLTGGQDRTGRFALALPFAPTGPAAIAAAKGRALSQLARQIAQEALAAGA